MKAVITDYEFPNIDQEMQLFRAAGVAAEAHQCRTPEEVIERCAGAHALVVHWAPVTRAVVDRLSDCKVIVRYGTGYENIDIAAADARGIAVCNVPDYASSEVADHAMSMALALGRHLPMLDRRLRSGVWKICADHPMAPFHAQRFVMLGFGRIAREVIHRARAFGFELAAHDPFVPEEDLRKEKVLPLTLTEALETADILSLHLPVTPKTRNLISRQALGRMKSSAILINTSRGQLVDSFALVDALREGKIFAAGLDVFDPEPLEKDHPLLSCPHALLTSHLAWHSTESLVRLQRMAAEEVLRGLLDQPLRNRIRPNVSV